VANHAWSFAEAAKAEGSDVVVVSSKQSRVDAALTLLGEGAEGHVADLSDETAVEALFGKMGPFDHLVYTAGDSVWQSEKRLLTGYTVESGDARSETFGPTRLTIGRVRRNRRNLRFAFSQDLSV
jgi:NAD(P)-dependent dehydrogenase (short-subunit alcohol dehydrogenase family)